MPKHTTGKPKREMTVTLAYDPDTHFSWALTSPAGGSGSNRALGFESLHEMFSDLSFLELLVEHFGTASVPDHAIAVAKSRRAKVPKEIAASLKQRFGTLLELGDA